MGQRSQLKGLDKFIDRAHRSGRAFQHVQELYRDSWLNSVAEASNAVVFDIERQAIEREDINERAARRMVRDLGTGMSESVLRNVYADVGLSATADESPFIKGADPQRHQRHGIGGRVSTLQFNRYGYVTVTTEHGTGRALMMWHFIHDGEIQVRNLPTFQRDGKEWAVTPDTDIVVPPYIEPDFIRCADDPEFSNLLISLGFKPVTEDDVDWIENPEAGLDWTEVLTQAAAYKIQGQEWYQTFKPIATKVSRADDGTVHAFTADGSPAHGTVKVMLGDTPYSHTAITGDPAFSEHDPDAYGAFLHRNLVDIPVPVSTLNLFPRSNVEKHGGGIELNVHTAASGSATTVETFTYQHREASGIRSWTFGDGNEWVDFVSEPIVVDDDGTTLKAYVLKDHPSVTSTSWKATTRRGFIATYYNNELYGVRNDMRAYRKFGIGNSAFSKRVMIIVTPPLSDSRDPQHAGVENDDARSTLRWWTPGKAMVDVSDKYEDWAWRYLAQEPQGIKDLKPESKIDSEKFGATGKLAEELLSHFKDMGAGFKAMLTKTSGTKKIKEKEETGEADKHPALVQGRGRRGMDTLGDQAKTEVNPRPVCAICGHKQHLEWCPNYTEAQKSEETETEKATAIVKGLADPKSEAKGGPSQAAVTRRRTIPKTTSPEPSDIELPEVVEDLDDSTIDMFAWSATPGDHEAKRHAGKISVNIDKEKVAAWLRTNPDGKNQPKEFIGAPALLWMCSETVRTKPGYDPEDIVTVVVRVFGGFAIEHVMFALAHRMYGKSWNSIKERFLDDTWSVMLPVSAKYKIGIEIAKLAHAAPESPAA